MTGALGPVEKVKDQWESAQWESALWGPGVAAAQRSPSELGV